MAEFEPKIVAVVCNWCTYAGADLTGTSRIKYAPNVRMLRLPCTGRVDFMLILQAFAQGADGVIVSGCHPGDCHYTSGNFHARRRWIVFRQLLDFIGIDVRRVHFAWVSAAEGAKWAEIVNSVAAEIRALGPYDAFPKRLAAFEWNGAETGATSSAMTSSASADNPGVGPPRQTAASNAGLEHAEVG